MRISVAESLRFPGEGKSAQGKAGPKTSPTGVVDGQPVNIPALTVRSKRSADSKATRDSEASVSGWKSSKKSFVGEP